MSKKLEKMSNEELEKKIEQASLYRKNINTLIVVVIIISILLLLLGDTSGSGLGGIALLMVYNFYLYPTQIGKLKTELNNRVSESKTI